MAHFQTVRDLLHLVWFGFPLFAMVVVGREENTEFLAFIGVIAQILLAIGYVQGWNVR